VGSCTPNPDKTSEEGNEPDQEAAGERPGREKVGRAKGKSGDVNPADKTALGKRRRDGEERGRGWATAVQGRSSTEEAANATAAVTITRCGAEKDVLSEETAPKDDSVATTESTKATAESDEQEVVQPDREKEAAPIGTDVSAKMKVLRAPPQGVQKMSWLVSGGRTKARRRRQRRAEDVLAIAKGMLTTEFREQKQERTKGLRVLMQHVIGEVQEVTHEAPMKQRRRVMQRVVAAVRTAERQQQRTEPGEPQSATPVRATEKESQPESITEAEWKRRLKAYEQGAPKYLEEAGSLAEMRALRRAALKEPKVFRAARRVHRLQRTRLAQEATATARQAVREEKALRKRQAGYHYVKRGGYGDIELVKGGDGKVQRKAQLHAAGKGAMTSLPTALLAVSKTRTLEVRLDTCAPFSIAGDELRQYGRCLTRSAPVDVVEGFGGGQARVLGVWQFTGTTVYQQRVTVNALVVEGQRDEMLIGEDWMAERQVKMDFGRRELKFLNEMDERVDVPFRCHGVTPLLEAPGEWAATVRLAKTVKLPTNTRGVLRMTVNAAEGTTGLFLPKPTSKRHLLLAPTLDVVRNGMIRVAVLNVEGRRKKLPARDVLGMWVPTDETMTMLDMNGELSESG
jgi:hypothetical protein